MIGRGGFGKVWKALDKKFKKFYALKEISKVKVIDKKSINSIIYERELLSRLHHPLIINLHYAFQDFDYLYLVLDLLTGGDLRYQIGHHPKQYFSEYQTKFFISCIVESLNYIHKQNIIHRDIKPENLVFDNKGYLHITDFGIAKFKSKNNRNETSGTPGYMAPEVMKGQNHTGSVDYFAVGVIGYELMMGQRPYLGKTRKEIKEQMMSMEILINEENIPLGWSNDSVDFINRLLRRKDIKRLGYNNDDEIKNHRWLSDINFEELNKKKINAPFWPKINHDNYDKKYCEEIEKIGFETNFRYEEYKLNENYNDIFTGFTFYNVDESQIKIYKKPNIKYASGIQNQKFRSISISKSKTINYDNLPDKEFILGNNIELSDKKTIEVEKKEKKKDKMENIDDDVNLDKKNYISYGTSYSKKKAIEKISISSHKRTNSNTFRHNFLYFLQRRKLHNLNNTLDISKNKFLDNNFTSKKKENCSINYHIHGEEKKTNEKNNINSNLYINILNLMRNKDEINEDYFNSIKIDDTVKDNKKNTIEVNHIPRLIKLKKSLRNNKKSGDLVKEILDLGKSEIRNPNLKKYMMKLSNNFYRKQKINVNRITPNNKRNNYSSLYKKNNNYDTINIDKSINNSKRIHIKARAKSFSGNPHIDIPNNDKIINQLSSLENSIEQNGLYRPKKEMVIKINEISNKKNKVSIISHNHSYSSFKNKKKIEKLIQNLLIQDKPKKNTIPIIPKKSTNTIVNPKISALHKKIPAPLTFGQKIFHERMNGFICKKLRIGNNNGFNTTINNNNSISNTSLSKSNIQNINRSYRKDDKINNNNPGLKIFLNSYTHNVNNTTNNLINTKKKPNWRMALNTNSNNYSTIIKKLNDFTQKHKKNLSIGNVKGISKEGKIINQSKKFTIKNNLIRNKLKKLADKKNNKDNKNDKLSKNEQNGNETNYKNNLKNDNIIGNKKICNCNHKNSINNKNAKNSLGSFSYHSYKSPTTSGYKVFTK